MQASRRLVLGALGALPFVSACGHSTAITDTSRYLACARTPEGTFAAVVLNGAGEMLSTIPLPGRGHTAAISPDKAHVIVFGRRPSEFMVAINFIIVFMDWSDGLVAAMWLKRGLWLADRPVTACRISMCRAGL